MKDDGASCGDGSKHTQRSDKHSFMLKLHVIFPPFFFFIQMIFLMFVFASCYEK